MTNSLVLAPLSPESRAGEPLALTPAQARLRKLVLDAVPSPHTQRNYGKALDDLFAFCASRPLTRSLFNGLAGGRGVALAVHYKRSALRRAQAGGRGQSEQHDRIGGGGQPDRRPQHQPEGNPAGELADPRAGQRTPGRPRPLDL